MKDGKTLKSRAAIDIGSNTVQFLMIKEQEVLMRKQFVTSLGYDLDKTKYFHEKSMKDTRKAIAECVKFCAKESIDPKEIRATATEASRVAINGEEFYQSIKNDLGVDVEIISSKKEALLSAKGILWGQKENDFIAIDIGGASTEFISVQSDPFEVKNSISLPIGSVRMNNWKKEENITEMLNSNFFSYDLSIYNTHKLIGVAGTMTSLAMMVLKLNRFEASLIDGTLLKSESLKEIEEQIIDKNSEEILKIYPFLGKRSLVIKSGLELVLLIMEKLNAKEIQVSTQGLVFGSIQS